jgi:hypothetical protein
MSEAKQTPYKKWDSVTYRSGQGWLYTASVQRVHRDGTLTVRLGFPIRNGRVVGGHQGDYFRVDPAHNILGKISYVESAQ